MKGFKSGTRINCETIEEKNDVLDIFEMLGYRWNGGERPRQYASNPVPMCYIVQDEHRGKFIQSTGRRENAIEAKDLHNMCISLKRRQHEIRW